MSTPAPHIDLRAMAAQVMRAHGFPVDMPPSVAQQLHRERRQMPDPSTQAGIKDLRHLPWSSIDNDTSRDLDQLEAAEQKTGGAVTVMVAIADVDAFVPKESPIDRFASQQTTTVYTGVRIFPMLPEELSTGATSLLPGADKLALVVEFTVTASGHVESSSVYRATVRNRAQLAYGETGRWLDGRGPVPVAIGNSPELQSQLRLQNEAARALRNERHRCGALNIETIETRPVLQDAKVVGLETEDKNSATALIEDFMIAANEVVARLLETKGVSSIRRIVRTPARWDRIVELAAGLGGHLPPTPDSRALNAFLIERAAADRDHFPDLSLSVIKLMGPGEYVLERAGENGQGHFGLAVEDYTHSTAPNRRFADLVTQRLLKAVLGAAAPPYSDDALGAIAATCTAKANEARKVEREMSKRIAAVVMQPRIGERFDAIVTGVTPHGTFVRIINPHVEGMLARGANGLDVGDKLRVVLLKTDVEQGYIDFARV